MGKTKRSDEEEQAHSNHKRFVFSDSDDDAEANEDLSLRIVERAMSRSGGAAREDIVTTELVDLESGRKKSKKEKKEKKSKKLKMIESENKKVNDVPEGQSTETVEGLEVVKLSEQEGADKSDNEVLRRLLRGPRYFDPEDNSWGTCYNCGEEGHLAVNCKSAKRKKPCFICGSFEHGAKECQKGKDCFICNKSGHRAKDCPKKFKKCSQGSDSCLKCGSSGHVMSSCTNDYSLDDLKEIQCYVCKSFGHLCCANYFGTLPSETSCYRCGQLGHTGLACKGTYGEKAGESTPSSCYKCGEEGHFARECSNSYKARTYGEKAGESTPSSCYKCGQEGHFARECFNSVKARTYGEMAGEDTPSFCYKCGEEGHFARECVNSYKVKKWSHDSPTPKRKDSKEQAYKGYKSAPQDGNVHKKKKLKFDEENTRSSSTWKQPWRSWIMDDPADFPRGKGVEWDSHSSPNDKGYNYRSSGRHASTSRSPGKFDSPYSRTPNSQSSRSYIQNGYSASRFGTPSSGEPRRRNYDRW